MDIVYLIRQLRFLTAAVKLVISKDKVIQLYMETERTPIDTSILSNENIDEMELKSTPDVNKSVIPFDSSQNLRLEEMEEDFTTIQKTKNFNSASTLEVHFKDKEDLTPQIKRN